MNSQTLPIVLAASLAAGTAGYVLGARLSSSRAGPSTAAPREGTSAGQGRSKGKGKAVAPPTPASSSSSEGNGEGALDTDSDAEDERENVAAGKLGAVRAGTMEECKLVLVVNQELGMSKGKIAAQCSHATLACYKTLSAHNPRLLRHWERWGQAKVAVKAQNVDQLLELQKQAIGLGLCARVIQDAGRTQIASGSKTVLGVGPGPIKLINQVTGHLKLL